MTRAEIRAALMHEVQHDVYPIRLRAVTVGLENQDATMGALPIGPTYTHGLMAHLADHECPHGKLGSDRIQTCACFGGPLIPETA